MIGYWTPAHDAVEHENAETLAWLLADGADPSADPEPADPDGCTPLDMAAQYGHDLAANLLRARSNWRAGGNR
ncbi:ankyrin repeat domain-containing protein [Streptomyces sp. R21]|uniref:Ankyrin repeat domain-containing protein n=1 Tax=Streptomyces sp. R21 TaxID=3238627 RepID=A0AB39P3F2_9ACTN